MELTRHLPVMLEEVVESLGCRPDGVYVDATVGSGGHAQEILERSSPGGRLIGLDRDPQAVRRAQENLAPFGKRAEIVEENFKNLEEVLKSLGVEAVLGIILDLGLSTEQLEQDARGFSFLREGPLDMRMSTRTQVTARDLLKRLSVAEIRDILYRYGEERWAGRISKSIVRRRQIRPLETTRDLAELVARSVPRPRGRIHPATRTFQALRIAVNEELDNLQSFLDRSRNLLHPGGRLAIISFHSLEDRMVKNHFRQWAKGEGKREDSPSFRLLTPKPLVPSPTEVFSNPRARSAKLRVIERLL